MRPARRQRPRQPPGQAIEAAPDLSKLCSRGQLVRQSAAEQRGRRQLLQHASWPQYVFARYSTMIFTSSSLIGAWERLSIATVVSFLAADWWRRNSPKTKPLGGHIKANGGDNNRKNLRQSTLFLCECPGSAGPKQAAKNASRDTNS